MATNRKCLVCGTKYNYCPKCAAYANEPKWKIEFDSEECKELFEAVSSYNISKGKRNYILDVLSKYNIVDYSKYSEGIQKAIGIVKNTSITTTVETVSEEINEPIQVNNEFVPKKAKKKKWQQPSVDIDLNEEVTENITTEDVVDLPTETVDDAFKGMSNF